MAIRQYKRRKVFYFNDFWRNQPCYYTIKETLQPNLCHSSRYLYKLQLPATSSTFSSFKRFSTFFCENSQTDCLERNIRFSLSEEEHKRRMDEKMKENEEEFFLLQSLKELTPLIRLIIKELAGMIRNDERRQLFLYTVLQGNIKDISFKTIRQTVFISIR